MSILKNAQKYSRAARLKFHTPGHKGSLDCRDLTEVNEGDVFPADSIMGAEGKAARIYDVPRTRFLTNGSSIGIKAAILAVKSNIVTWEYAHTSVFEGAALANVRCVQIKTNQTEPPAAEDYINELDKHPDCSAVVITNPTYLGQYFNHSGLYEQCKKRNIVLVVDGAHGAHYGLNPSLPQSPSKFCDIAVMSAHKTLPALTQSSLMTISNPALFDSVDGALALLGTTSPSYLLLGSIEHALEYTLKNAGRYNALYEAVKDFKSSIPCLDNSDFTRLVVCADKLGFGGEELQAALNRRGAYCEKVFGNYVVFILTVCDSVGKIKKLKQILLKIKELK